MVDKIHNNNRRRCLEDRQLQPSRLKEVVSFLVVKQHLPSPQAVYLVKIQHKVVFLVDKTFHRLKQACLMDNHRNKILVVFFKIKD